MQHALCYIASFRYSVLMVAAEAKHILFLQIQVSFSFKIKFTGLNSPKVFRFGKSKPSVLQKSSALVKGANFWQKKATMEVTFSRPKIHCLLGLQQVLVYVNKAQLWSG